MHFRTTWIISLAIVAATVIASFALWALVPWSQAISRYTGLALAVSGVTAVYPYLKASRLDEYVRASIPLLLWLFLAIGFALRTML